MGSWKLILWDMNPLSPQDCLLPQQTYLSFCPTPVSQYWILEQQVAKIEFSNIYT